MPMQLSEVQSRVKTVDVSWEEETVAVGYAPARFTPEVLEQVAAAEQAGDLGILGSLLAPVVEWWDVLDDDGQRIPPTPENIRRFPLSFIMAVMAKLQEDMRPPEQKA